MIEQIKAWLQPGIVLVVAVQAFSTHGWVTGIDTRSINTAQDVVTLKTDVRSLEAGDSVATAQMAVVETKLGYMVESLKRIENRMEAASDRKR